MGRRLLQFANIQTHSLFIIESMFTSSRLHVYNFLSFLDILLHEGHFQY